MNKKYGVTGPLSLKNSNDFDKKKSAVMSDYLIEIDFFESLTELQERERVIGLLNHLAKEHFDGSIHTFGSYRLGVHQKNADIDALLISPNKFTHSDFFSTFYEVLTPFAQNIQKIEEAYVPIIKLTIKNIDIDLLFAKTSLQSLESLNLLDDSVLKHLDDKSILSLNGSRVTDMLISLIPNPKVFQTALRCIKYWAKRRGIYGNSYGYFGGVAYAIAVARICQFYPNMDSYSIIYKFFEVYTNWQWPKPVLLNEIVDRKYNLRIWNEKMYHKMPVITPAYPAMCSTHNVSTTTMKMMLDEMSRALEILKEAKVYDKNKKDERQENAVDENAEATKLLCNQVKPMKDISLSNENIDVESIKQSKSKQSIKESEKHNEGEAKEHVNGPDANRKSTLDLSLQINKDNSPDSEKTLGDKINYNKEKTDDYSTFFVNLLKKLFVQSNFFVRYKAYLQIKIVKDDEWAGYVESKIRFLCAKIENVENYNANISILAIPFPVKYILDDVYFFVGIDYHEKISIDINKPIDSFIETLENKKDIEIKIVKKKHAGCILKQYYERKNGLETQTCEEKNVKRIKINEQGSTCNQ